MWRVGEIGTQSNDSGLCILRREYDGDGFNATDVVFEILRSFDLDIDAQAEEGSIGRRPRFDQANTR
jgi:hypothetical protein